ncbi:hypothetical protein Acy02nite_07580 [Actinoplanes cyaneus]|uniref:Uncharacterized protein n=1 Tax=Actinoplanes cyaneus TaxID=52696 RepID=A0A919ICF4_9ACTN|nr:hypothetical protein [Actinoplanes cyaneus]MCW2135760.1 hypothetical protein [Actinoplanes cyaneus]GID62877.1 hypothetical protein Acy02nite_07580 [Actinoplanes cyaneus]
MSQAPVDAKVRTEGGSHGAVADTIHGGVHNNYYELPPPEASLEEKLESALRFLRSGQPTTARRLLDEVIAEDRDSGEICFHWLLAFFGGRTFWELSEEESERVMTELKRIVELPRSRWSAGIGVIQRLVLAGRSRPDEPFEGTGIEADLNSLPTDLSAAIRTHLERLIQGSLKDELWHRDVQEAQANQKAGNRRTRVWKFFEPDPRPPRICPVRGFVASPVVRASAGISTTVVIVASGTLGWLVAQRGDVSATVALVGLVVTVGIALRLGVEWRFRDEALRASERERRAVRFSYDALRPGGFADQVDRLYRSYVRRFAPSDDRERRAWLDATEIPLSRLRNDLVEAYREREVGADEIKWLVRFQVRDMRIRWTRGEELDPRPGVPARLRLAAGADAVLSLIALAWVTQSALRQDVLRATGAVLVLALAGAVAFMLGLRILADHKHVRVRRIDRERRLEQYNAEYRRWLQRLADRPTDTQMAQWLDCDRRLLLNRAIEEYRLKWSDIQAYASLEARGRSSRKARVKNGPWRYTRYRLLVFLLTSDGVRQLTTELDFEDAKFLRWERTNYRYDAVAAVQVSVRDDEASEFHLHLVNGADIEVAVTENGRPGVDEDPRVLADAVQDATGLRHALFVLEGIAAEGRRWWKGAAYRRGAGSRT